MLHTIPTLLLPDGRPYVPLDPDVETISGQEATTIQHAMTYLSLLFERQGWMKWKIARRLDAVLDHHPWGIVDAMRAGRPFYDMRIDELFIRIPLAQATPPATPPPPMRHPPRRSKKKLSRKQRKKK